MLANTCLKCEFWPGTTPLDGCAAADTTATPVPTTPAKELLFTTAASYSVPPKLLSTEEDIDYTVTQLGDSKLFHNNIFSCAGILLERS